MTGDSTFSTSASHTRPIQRVERFIACQKSERAEYSKRSVGQSAQGQAARTTVKFYSDDFKRDIAVPLKQQRNSETDVAASQHWCKTGTEADNRFVKEKDHGCQTAKNSDP